MRTYGLVGYPLTHSFSQKYFTGKFKQLGITDTEYVNFSIPAIEELEGIIARYPGLSGFNITIPHKKNILPYLQEATDAVKRMGACNCVLINNGKLKGYNTDVVGFEQSLKPFLRTGHRSALILGTGGAAAAVEYVLQNLGIEYHFVSRNPANGQLSYAELNEAIMQQNQLIINTSPVGQFPKEIEFPGIPYQYIGSGHHLFDLIYNPEETAFLQKGKAMGATTQNGYEMLVLQAEESWRIWNNR